MSCVTRIESGAESERPATRKFGRAARSKSAPETVARQAKLTLLAFQAFDERAEALAFLNDHHAELDGRPIDIAGETDDGLAAATAALAARG